MRKPKHQLLHVAALSLFFLFGYGKAYSQNYYAANAKQLVNTGYTISAPNVVIITDNTF